MVSEPIQVLTGIEGRWPALENILRQRADGWVIKRANTRIRRAPVISIVFEDHDDLCVAKHGYVCIMGARNNLSLSFKIPKPSNNTLVNEVVVQVVLRLVDNERRIGCSEQ